VAASALLDAILAISPELDVCVIQAFARGWLDIPFAPSRYNAGRARVLRDASFAVRLLDPGAMPVPACIVARHRELLEARIRLAGCGWDDAPDLLAADVMVMSNPRRSWPLGNS
jgi:methylaspartate mutase epsilon subunit